MASHFGFLSRFLFICVSDNIDLAMREVFAGNPTPAPEALSGDDPQVNLFVRGLHQIRIEAPLMVPLAACPSAAAAGTLAALGRGIPVENVRIADAAVHQVLSVRRDLGTGQLYAEQPLQRIGEVIIRIKTGDVVLVVSSQELNLLVGAQKVEFGTFVQ